MKNIDFKPLYRRKLVVALLIIAVMMVGGLFYIKMQKTSAPMIFCLENLHNDDAKFYGSEDIITSVNGLLCMYGVEDGTVETYDISSNWLDCIEQDGVIVYANWNHEIGMVRLDENKEVLSKKVLWTSDFLYIDPAIIKMGDCYYMTITCVEGTVNNADIKAENGFYTIELYASRDIENWYFVADVVSERHNLEDVKLVDDHGRLLVIYEKEIVDKGDSYICCKRSLNESFSEWEDEVILVDSNADNEPAGMLIRNNNYYLFYSSDLANPGESYMGGEIYRLKLMEDMAYDKAVVCKCSTNKGISLYDVVEKGDSIEYLTTLDHLTDGDLAVFVEGER